MTPTITFKNKLKFEIHKINIENIINIININIEKLCSEWGGTCDPVFCPNQQVL